MTWQQTAPNEWRATLYEGEGSDRVVLHLIRRETGYYAYLQAFVSVMAMSAAALDINAKIATMASSADVLSKAAAEALAGARLLDPVQKGAA